jgi:YYY domain-containing protein
VSAPLVSTGPVPGAGRPDGPSRPGRRFRAAWWATVGLVVLVGLVLRLWGLDFDERQHLHPDERHWSLTASALAESPDPVPHGTLAGPVLDWLDGQRSPANAYRGSDSFVYGPAPLAWSRSVAGWLHRGAVGGDEPAATVVSTADRLGVPLLDEAGAPRFDDRYQVDLVGRLLGALADVLAIVVVALIGRRLGGDAAGVLAALAASCSVLAIQHAHFLGSEPFVGLAAALTVWACLRLDRGAGRRAAVRTGVPVGLAAGALVAMKFTGLGLALVPVGLCGWLAVSRRRPADAVRLVVVALGMAVGFRVLNPGAFDGLGLGLNAQFWEDQRRATELAMADLPPAITWAGRVPVLTPLDWLLRFTVGPGTVLAALVGVLVLVRRLVGPRFVGRGPRSGAGPVRGRWEAAVVVASVVVPFLFVLRQPVTSGRYFVPMLPALHAAAGFGIAWLAARVVADGARWRRWAPTVAAMGLVGLTVLWGVAFVAGVYGSPHTRVQASRWIAANVEPGDVLTVEAWDDGLPLAVEGVDPSAYGSEQLDLFGVDSVEKTERLARQLTTVDLVVESSPRVWGSVTRLPARFPSTIAFFEALDSGTLGFERVATFSSPPRIELFGRTWLRLDERGAEEAFSVYDHPEVRIWRKVRAVPEREVLARLDPVAAATAVPVAPAAGSANGTMLHEAERAENRRVGTYADQFDGDGHPLLHALVWLAVVQLVGLAAFVVLAPVLRRLPDAGLGIAPVVGLVVVTATVFVLVAWLGAPLTRATVLVAVVAWASVAALQARRRRSELVALWRTRRPALVRAQVLGLVAFGAMLLLRAANPDLWHPYRGGEKPFELSMFTAVLRTRTLPPYDPWFSGGTLNYHYGGYLLLSVPARLARTTPSLAMNLALPVVALLAAGAAYTAGAALASGRRWSGWDAGRGAGPGPVAGVAGVDRVGSGRGPVRAGTLAAVALLVVPNAAIVPSVVGRLLGREQGRLDWWALSRTIPGSPAPTEFPAWSFLFGDVHGHLLDLPLVLTVVALAVAWRRVLLAGPGPSRPLGRWRSAPVGWVPALGLAAVTGLVVGATRLVNTWDLPLVGLVAAAVPLSVVRQVPVRWWLANAVAGGVTAVGVWWPYARRSEVSDAGAELTPIHTPLPAWVDHWGFLAVVTLVVAAAVIGRGTAGRSGTTGSGVGPARWRSRSHGALVPAVVVAGSVGVALALGSVGLGTFAVAALLASAGALTARTVARRGGAWAGAALVAAVGWALVAAIEVVSVVNDFDRMNTVFKGWFQAWSLVVVGLATCVSALLPTPLLASTAGQTRRSRIRVHSIRGVLVVGALLAVAFWQLAAPARLDDRSSPGGLHLDGLAYLDAGAAAGFTGAADRPLISWLQEHVDGIVTVAEAPGQGYTWAGRVAGHTGLPTVVGWPYHQSQQRRAYEAAVRTREGDLAALYTSGDPATVTSVLQRYQVAYVVFGSNERALATSQGRDALASHPCLHEVYRRGEAFISRVDQACLPDQPGGLPVVTAGGG